MKNVFGVLDFRVLFCLIQSRQALPHQDMNQKTTGCAEQKNGGCHNLAAP